MGDNTIDLRAERLDGDYESLAVYMRVAQRRVT